jgi:SAM-dependent methyltransferase
VATRAETFFDGYAGDFNAIYGNQNTLVNRLVNRYLRRSMRLRFERVLSGAIPIEGKTALDIGCGPGHYSVELARRGAAHVEGLDFAQTMIDLARANAARAGVEGRCSFKVADFFAYPAEHAKFDYAVIMGVMDYIADPRPMIEKVVSLTGRKAFFSFPVAGGLLAWQRQLRYKNRCDLFLYDRSRLRVLFADLPCRDVETEQIDRDYFVTVHLG